MSVFELLQASTGLDPFFIANALFFGMVVLIWLVIGVLDQRDRRRAPPPAHWSGIGQPGSGIVSQHPGGWICRDCWAENRNRDVTCFRCERPAPSPLAGL